MATADESVIQLVAMLEKDRKSPHPKYPSQALSAIRHEGVARSLKQRFGTKSVLREIRLLDYDFAAGLNRICFDFRTESLESGGEDLLVVLDARCSVVGIVDPFDADQPNSLVPLSTERRFLPFVLERPSAGSDLPFTTADVATQDTRAHEFFVRAISRGGFGGGVGVGRLDVGSGFDDPCQIGGEGQSTVSAYCSISTSTLKWLSPSRYDRSVYHQDCLEMDSPSDDCEASIS